MKRKAIAILLSVTMMMGILSGCGSNTTTQTEESTNTEGSQSSNVQEETTEDGTTAGSETEGYYGNDISEHKDLVMYVIGDEPVAADAVQTALNEKLEEKLNTSLTINYIALSDYTQKYSLLLASGENIDLIYTSTWAFYNEEATKGAFVEITNDLLQQYMPQTYAGEDSMAFEQAKIDGACYMIPKNSPYVNNAMPVLIRGDLKEKYNIGEINSVEKLEEYFKAVAENEDGIYPYAAAG